jgi:hypothetical protein
LKAKDRDVRIAAATALGEVGPRARAAVPALKALLKAEEAKGGGEEVRNALDSIVRTGPAGGGV